MLIAALFLLVAGVALTPREPARRAGAPGLVAIGLAVAAAGLTPGSPPPGFLAVNAGLLLLGLAVCLAGIVAGIRQSEGVARAGPLLGLVGVGVAGWAALPAVRLAGAGRSAGVAAATGLGVALAAWVARRTGVVEAIRRRSREPAAESLAPAGLAGLVAAAAAAGLSDHVAIVIGGGILGAWAAWIAWRGGHRPLPLAPLLVTALLGTALWLLATIAGPEGLTLGAIPWLPLSAAAERLLAPLFLLALWGLAGLWPLHQPAGGALTAAVGAVILLRVALPAVPAGLEHWRPAILPLVVLGIWHAAITGRLTRVLVGAALLGLATVRPPGVAGAGWLLLAALAVELFRSVGRARMVARVLIALLACWGGLGILRAGLATEVVYTVLAAAGAAVALAGCRTTRAEAALTPYPAGSIFGRETR